MVLIYCKLSAVLTGPNAICVNPGCLAASLVGNPSFTHESLSIYKCHSDSSCGHELCRLVQTNGDDENSSQTNEKKRQGCAKHSDYLAAANLGQ